MPNKVKNPGAKGGKYYINSKGHVVYGEKPNSSDRLAYDPAKDFKEQFPSFEAFKKLASEKGVQEPSLSDYKQVYQREHKAFMKTVEEAKGKGEKIKGLGDKKDFLKKHVYFDKEKGEFHSKNFSEIEAEAKKAGMEVTKEEFMKHYKQEKYEELKYKKNPKPEPKVEPKPEPKVEPKPEPKVEPVEPKPEKIVSVFNEDGTYDYSKFPKIDGTFKQSKFGWSMRGLYVTEIKNHMVDDKLTDDEKKLLQKVASRAFLEHAEAQYWIERGYNKDNSKTPKVSLADMLAENLKGDKEISNFENLKSKLGATPKPEKKVEPKPEPKVEPKPEPKVEPEKPEFNLNGVNADNWHSFYKSYHNDYDSIEKSFPELKGGSKQVENARNARKSMILGWTMKKFQDDYIMNSSYTDNDIKLFADAVNNMAQETSAKKWIAMDDDYNTPFFDKLAEYSSNKEAFSGLIEKWKAGKADADKAEKEAKEKAEKEAEEKAKKEAEEKAKKDAEFANNTGSIEFQKEQVKKFQEILSDGKIDTIIDAIKKAGGGLSNANDISTRIDDVEKNLLGYKLTDWERKALTNNNTDMYAFARNIKDSMQAKINPETGAFNENIYDNFIRKSKKEVINTLDTGFNSDMIHKELTSIEKALDSGEKFQMTNYQHLPNKFAFTEQLVPIAKEIMAEVKNNTRTNSEAIMYIHDLRKQVDKEFDKYKDYKGDVGEGTTTGAGYKMKFNKFTPEEKKTALDLQKKLKAIDGIKTALAIRFEPTKSDIDDLLINTESNHNDPILNDVASKAKASKSKGFKPEVTKAVQFFETSLKQGLYKQEILFENLSKDRASAYQNTVYAKFSTTDASTYVHEMSHVLSNQNPSTIGLASNMFMAGRTSGLREFKLQNIEHSGYKASESAKPDSFAHSYIGKNYYNGADSRVLKHLSDATSNEVVSMGVQYMYENSMKFLIQDPEHFMLIHSMMKNNLK